MPTTRSRRAAARVAALQELIELPPDALGLVLYQLPLAHDIALTGLTCHVLHNAAKLASKARPFSSEVVTLAAYSRDVAVTADGHILTCDTELCSEECDNLVVKVWLDGACVRTIQANARTATQASIPLWRCRTERAS